MTHKDYAQNNQRESDIPWQQAPPRAVVRQGGLRKMRLAKYKGRNDPNIDPDQRGLDICRINLNVILLLQR